MSVPENSMFLRSNCRAHGLDCSCSDALSANSVHQRRSLSRTPSRASSVQPELSHHSQLVVNSFVDGLASNQNTILQYNSVDADTASQFSNSSSVHSCVSNQSYAPKPVNGRNIIETTETQSLCSQLSQSSSIHSRASNRSHMANMIRRNHIIETDTNSQYSQVSKSSSGNSRASRQSYAASMIRQNIVETDTTTLLTNGNHERLRSVTYFKANNVEAVAENHNDSLSSSLSHSIYDEGANSSSKMTAILSSIQNGLMFLPRLIYWSLVHLFVSEKWLLHRKGSVYSILRNLFMFLALLLFLGVCLSNTESLWKYVNTVRSTISIPISKEEVSPPGIQLPSCPPPLPPITTTNNEEYQKLLEKITYLEEKMNEYRETAGSYTQNLNILEQNLNIKFKEEVSKIEPTIIVEKHFTTVEKEFIPSPPIVQSAPEPEPLDPEKLSKMILPLILPEMLEKLKAELASMTKDDSMKNTETIVPHSIPSHFGLNLTDIERMIKLAIEKYDADKTGLPDLALEPAGGSILSTRCTKSSPSKNSVLTVWGWRIWSFSNSPRTIIQPGAVPGECWVVEGATAEVVIQLVSKAVITGFTLEHIPKAISPYGKIDTAPKKFEVVGLMHENDMDQIWNYGTFEYEDNGQPIQYFPVQNPTVDAYPIVELKVLSNHGSVKSTCIYRFRVHGEKIGWK